MKIDHIFIFSENNGFEAEDLTKFGLLEGSNRRHQGQGTINRKFYFENFFLELLWVVNKNEIKQSPTKETQLFERSNFRNNEFSRFGLCLVNSEDTDELFTEAQIYQPNYFPKGMSIDILPNSKNPQLPWTFRLPYRGEKKYVNEPTQHINQIRKLTNIKFEIEKLDKESKYIKFFSKQESIKFNKNVKSELVLEFDFGIQQKTVKFKELDLVIKY